jgi:hypothetical protein
MLTIVQVFFSTVVLDGFLLSLEGSSSMNLSPPLLPFLDLVSQKTLPSLIASFIGDNGSSNGLCSSGKLIVKINEAQL